MASSSTASSSRIPPHPAAIQSEPTATVQWDPKKSFRHMAAGAVGGMAGSLITAPLDVVKTRLQSSLFRNRVALDSKPHSLPISALQTSPSTASSSVAGETIPREVIKAGAKPKQANILYNFVETGHILRDIARNEGMAALWKGIGPTLVGVIPARSIQFFTYGNAKPLIAQHLNDGREASWVHVLAAACAGVATGMATNPIWVVKTRLQLSQSRRVNPALHALAPPSPSTASFLGMGPAQAAALRAMTPPKPDFTNAYSCTKFILRTEGIKGLYKGLSASMLGVSEGIIQWVVYERFKTMGVSEKGGKIGEWTGVLGAAGGAKMLAALLTYPHEVLRTRLRQPIPAGATIPKYTGLLQTLKLVVAEEGVKSMYGGLTAHLMRVVPNAIAIYSVYEFAMRW